MGDVLQVKIVQDALIFLFKYIKILIVDNLGDRNRAEI